jgi:hypothetical protein
MIRKVLGLAVLALLLMAVPASANQWYIQTPLKAGERNHGKRTRIPTGSSAEVTAEGTMNFHVRLNNKYRDSFKCHVNSAELLSNPTRTEAFAETTSITFSECEGAEKHPRRVTAVLMPWSGELGTLGETKCEPCTLNRPVGIEIEDEEINYGVFSGVLNANIGDGDNPVKDDLDHTLKWFPPGSALENARGELVIGGSEELGAEGDHACAENNEGVEEEEGNDKE